MACVATVRYCWRRLNFQVPHVFVGKPASTFPEHALTDTGLFGKGRAARQISPAAGDFPDSHNRHSCVTCSASIAP
jgi:hypothetical protein